MTRGLVVGIVLGLIAGLAVPAAAHAARSFTLGNGYSPAVAVEKDGTGHFAWYQDGGEIDRLRYCRVPRGQSECKGARTFTGTGDASYRNVRPFVFVSGQKVTLVASFERPQAAPVVHDHLVVQSSDGGQTFGTPYPVGDPQQSGPDAATNDGSGLGLLNDDVVFTGTPVGGPPIAGQSADLSTLIGRPELLDAVSMALVANKEPIVTSNLGRETVVYYPPGLSALRAVLPGAWKRAQILDDETQASLAGGSDGVYAMLLSTPGDAAPAGTSSDAGRARASAHASTPSRTSPAPARARAATTISSRTDPAASTPCGPRRAAAGALRTRPTCATPTRRAARRTSRSRSR